MSQDNQEVIEHLWIACIMTIALAAAVIVWTWMFLHDRYNESRAASYVSTVGRVLDVDVPPMAGNHNIVKPSISFEYSVGGNRYEGAKIAPGRYVLWGSNQWHDFTQRFQPDASIEVWYDPQEPSRSFLFKTSAGLANYMHGIFAIGGSVFLAIAVYAIYCARRHNAEVRAKNALA